MIGRVRESRNPKKVIRVTLMESYGEIGRVPVNLCKMNVAGLAVRTENAVTKQSAARIWERIVWSITVLRRI